jgi:hypothetical protein
MSTVAYGSLTARRKLSEGDTRRNSPPGIGVWADSFTALVPAEVLVFHEFMLPLFADGTEIISQGWALICLVGVFVLSLLFYGVGILLQAKKAILKGPDVWRIGLVWGALVCWILTQQPSALDAFFDPPMKWVYFGVPFAAIVLGLFAGLRGAYGAEDASNDAFEVR